MTGGKTKRLLAWLTKNMTRRVVRDATDAIYLIRYYVIRTSRFEITLHQFLRSDPDPRLHNHPWQWAISLLIVGGYVEERLEDNRIRSRTLRVGRFNPIRDSTFHRVSALLDSDAWSVFIHGRRIREWHFLEADFSNEIDPA